MYWGWWLPGTPRDPAVRDVRAGDGVLPAGLLLVVRQVPQVPAGRLDPPGDPPQAAGPVPGPAHQAGDLGDVLVFLGRAVLAGAGLPRAGGHLPDRVLVGGGDHPAAGEQHDPARGGHRQQVLDEIVAGAGPVDADQDLAPEPGRDLPDRRGQHLLVVGERVRARRCRAAAAWPGTRAYSQPTPPMGGSRSPSSRSEPRLPCRTRTGSRQGVQGSTCSARVGWRPMPGVRSRRSLSTLPAR